MKFSSDRTQSEHSEEIRSVIRVVSNWIPVDVAIVAENINDKKFLVIKTERLTDDLQLLKISPCNAGSFYCTEIENQMYSRPIIL